MSNFDNKWPIEWKPSEVTDNPQFVVDGLTYRKISDIAIDADWENATVELTAKTEAGEITAQGILTGGDIDGMYLQYAVVTEDIYFAVVLMYLPAGEYEGITVPETGLYYTVMDTDTGAEPDAEYDIKIKLSNPDLDTPAQIPFDLQSWLTGFVIGLVGKPLPIISKNTGG